MATFCATMMESSSEHQKYTPPPAAEIKRVVVWVDMEEDGRMRTHTANPNVHTSIPKRYRVLAQCGRMIRTVRATQPHRLNTNSCQFARSRCSWMAAIENIPVK